MLFVRAVLIGREKEMGSGDVSRMLGTFHFVMGSEFRAKEEKFQDCGPMRDQQGLLPLCYQQRLGVAMGIIGEGRALLFNMLRSSHG